MRSLFHLAYHVNDLAAARRFYGGVLGCAEGRSTETWVDFDFFGHQISLHLGTPFPTSNTGRVGEHLVPMPHLGLVLERCLQSNRHLLSDRRFKRRAQGHLLLPHCRPRSSTSMSRRPRSTILIATAARDSPSS